MAIPVSERNDGSVAVVAEHEAYLHPKAEPEGRRPAYSQPVDEAIQPRTRKSLAFRQNRRTSILTPFCGENCDFISEWRSLDLEEIELGRWAVPDRIDTTPSAAARTELREMNQPRLP